MYKQIALTLALLTIAVAIQAQTIESDEKTIEGKIENAIANSDTEKDYSALLDDLDALKESSFNLNKVTRADLERSALFNDIQINALLDHVALYGALLNIYELQAVEGYDLEFIHSILPYVTISATSALDSTLVNQMLTKGKHQVLVRAQQTLERSRGYGIEDPSKTRYLGSPLRAYARHRYNYKNRLQVGFTAEKDPGEEFFTGSQKQGFDYYSAHVIVRNIGHLSALALGDYQLQYGQGLVMWSGLAFGKTADVMNIRKYGVGIRPHNSIDENAALRGAAISVATGKIQTDVFFSYKGIDANISGQDSIAGATQQVSSIQESGYHRTPAEIADKHSLQQTVMGVHIAYAGKRLGIGATYLHMQLSAPLMKAPSDYNQFTFAGTANDNMGLHYNYQYKSLSLFGEAAGSSNGGTATVNGILLALGERVSLSMLHRNYSRNYQALYSQGFGENSNTANESGIYWGLLLKPSSLVTFSAYYDLFTFPWRKYLVSSPSNGYEAMLLLVYTPSKRIEFDMRARWKEKGKNVAGIESPIDYIEQVQTRNVRLNASYRISPTLTFRNRLEFNSYKTMNGSPDEGFMVYQDVIYTPANSRFKATMRYALFETDSYNSRIYAYESDVQYYYYIPSYYYHGNRMYAMVQYRIAKGVDLWLRYGTTMYSNRKTIGTSLDEISGNTKSELKFQLRVEL